MSTPSSHIGSLPPTSAPACAPNYRVAAIVSPAQHPLHTTRHPWNPPQLLQDINLTLLTNDQSGHRWLRVTPKCHIPGISEALGSFGWRLEPVHLLFNSTPTPIRCSPPPPCACVARTPGERQAAGATVKWHKRTTTPPPRHHTFRFSGGGKARLFPSHTRHHRATASAIAAIVCAVAKDMAHVGLGDHVRGRHQHIGGHLMLFTFQRSSCPLCQSLSTCTGGGADCWD